MSALTAPLVDLQSRRATRTERPALRAVQINPMRVSRALFIAFLTVVLGVGMVGVLVLNTTIQQRQSEITKAQRQADDLAYKQASLTATVEQLRSSSDLATRAWAMGMRPNPHPAFVQLGAAGEAGRIVGTPARTVGTEMPDQNYVGADAVATKIDKTHADAVARKKAAAKAAAEKAAAARAAAVRAAADKAVADKAAAASAEAAKAQPAAKATAPGTQSVARTSPAGSTGGR